jgi:hypothetical protein
MTTEQSRTRTWLRAVGVGAVLLGGLALFFYVFRDSSSVPKLDRQQFDEHLDRWRANKPDHYDIIVTVEGMQPGVYQVKTRSGIATAAMLDGRALRDQRTFGTWSVSGTFDTIRRDLETNDEHGYLLLRCQFDSQYGYPMSYDRIELRTYAHDALRWSVTHFEVKSGDDP